MKSFKQILNENQKIVIKKPWGVEIKDYKSGDPIPAGTKFKIFDAKDTAKIDAYADSLDESVVNEDSKRKPYLLKNAKVGDVFRDAGDLSREYKITKVTPSKVYATCVKQPSTTAEYNRLSSEYNETDPQYTKLFTVNESTIKESLPSNYSKSKFLKEVEEACRAIEGEISQIRKYAKASNFDMIETYYQRIANFSKLCAEGAKDIAKYAKAGTLTEDSYLIQNKRTKDFIDDSNDWTVIRTFAKKFNSKEDAQKYIDNHMTKNDDPYMEIVKA